MYFVYIWSTHTAALILLPSFLNISVFFFIHSHFVIDGTVSRKSSSGARDLEVQEDLQLGLIENVSANWPQIMNRVELMNLYSLITNIN